MTGQDSERLDALERRLSGIAGALYTVLSDIRADFEILKGSLENRMNLAEGILRACGVPLGEVSADLDENPPRPSLASVQP